MSIIFPNLNYSFISPVPVPVPNSGSVCGFPDFPYALCDPIRHLSHRNIPVLSATSWTNFVSQKFRERLSRSLNLSSRVRTR